MSPEAWLHVQNAKQATKALEAFTRIVETMTWSDEAKAEAEAGSARYRDMIRSIEWLIEQVPT